MSNQHTPGPWTVELPEHGKTRVGRVKSETGKVVVEVGMAESPYRANSMRLSGTAMANARLIAASPTLLESAAASIEAINQGEADMALIYLRHAVKQAVEGGEA